MNQQGISQKHIAETLGGSRCAVQELLDHHRGNADVSYLPSSCRLRCTTVINRQVDLYATVSGTGPGLGVVDLDTNVDDRLVIHVDG